MIFHAAPTKGQTLWNNDARERFSAEVKHSELEPTSTQNGFMIASVDSNERGTLTTNVNLSKSRGN